jgi:hypothetical protein
MIENESIIRRCILGKSNFDELNAQWYNNLGYWEHIQQMTPKIDRHIIQFNEKVELI